MRWNLPFTLVLLLTTSPSIAGGALDAPGPTPSGDAHWIRVADRVLSEASLRAGDGVLPADQPHEFQVQLESKRIEGQVRVFLHYAVQGAEPSPSGPTRELLVVSSGGGVTLYQASVDPVFARNPDRDVVVRFYYTIHTASQQREDRPTSETFYQYIADAQAPVLSSLRFNGESRTTTDGTNALQIRLIAEDGGGIQDASVGLEGTGQTRLVHLEDDGEGFVGTLEAGSLQPGLYDATATAKDHAGHSTSMAAPGVIRVGQTPQAVEGRDALTVRDDVSMLHLDELHATASLDGFSAHRFTLRLEPGQEGEEVALRLHYRLDGHPPEDEGPTAPLNRVGSTEDAWTYEARLSGPTLAGPTPEHPIRFFITVDSSYFPPRRIPATGDYAYTRDAAPPRLHDVLLNGQPEVTLRAGDALLAEVGVEDASGVDHAEFSLHREGTLHLQAPLTVEEGQLHVDLPDGVGLPDGTYDVHIEATDAHGHRSVPRKISGALSIDSTPPRVESVLLNGQSRLVARGDVGLGVEIRTAAQAAGVELELLRDNDVQRRVSLSSMDGVLWRHHWSTGVGLPDGAYHARVVARDGSGNQATTSSGSILVVDNTPPDIQLQSLQYPPGRGAATPGGYVDIWIEARDDNQVGDVTAATPRGTIALPYDPARDAYHARLTAPDTSGSHTARVQAGDDAGNTAFLDVEFLVDATPPVIQRVEVIQSRPGDAVRPGDEVEFRVHAVDTHTSVQRVLVDVSHLNPHSSLREAFRDAGASHWTASTGVQAQGGDHPVTILVHDAAGNQATHTVTVAVQSGAPSVSSYLVDGQRSLLLPESRPIRFEAHMSSTAPVADLMAVVEDAEGNQAKIPLIAEGTGVYARRMDPGLPDGAYWIRIHGTDSAGRNIAAADPEPRLVIDGKPPRVESFLIDSGLEGNAAQAFFDHDVSFTAIVVDHTLQNVSIDVQLPSGARTAFNLSRDGDAWSAKQNFADVGLATATLNAHDAFGRSTVLSRSFELLPRNQDDPPGPVRDLHVADAQPTIRWLPPETGGPFHGYAVALDREPNYADIIHNTDWNPDLEAGTYIVAVRAVDVDGNLGPVGRINLTHPASDPPEKEPIAEPRIEATLPPETRSNAVLSWSTTQAYDCFDVEARSGGAWTLIADCQEENSLEAFVGFTHGDAVEVRVRGRAGDAATAWQLLGSTVIDDEPPAQGNTTHREEDGTLSVEASLQEDTARAWLVVRRNGTSVEEVPLEREGDRWRGEAPVRPGDEVVLVYEDAAGNRREAVLDSSPPTQEEERKEDSGGTRTLVVVAVVAGVLAAVAITALFLLRRFHARSADPVQTEVARSEDWGESPILVRDMAGADEVRVQRLNLDNEATPARYLVDQVADGQVVAVPELSASPTERRSPLAQHERSPTGPGGRLDLVVQE